jgi:hypothetical protein
MAVNLQILVFCSSSIDSVWSRFNSLCIETIISVFQRFILKIGSAFELEIVGFEQNLISVDEGLRQTAKGMPNSRHPFIALYNLLLNSIRLYRDSE